MVTALDPELSRGHIALTFGESGDPITNTFEQVASLPGREFQQLSHDGLKALRFAVQEVGEKVVKHSRCL